MPLRQHLLHSPRPCRRNHLNVFLANHQRVGWPITVETLIRPEHKHSLTMPPYSFCDSPDCEVVYVPASGESVITKNQLRVRVGIKEKEEPIPLCYCFDFEKKQIYEDVRSTGRTDIPKIITQRVKAGECRCQVTNPSGNCCLCDIYRAVKDALSTKTYST